MKKNKRNVVMLLEAAGVRITPCRKIIIEILQKSPGHYDVKELYSEIQKRLPSVGLASVYRNLCVLGQSGIIEKISMSDDGAIFELSERHHPLGHHHHLICEVCGKVIIYNDFVEKERSCADAAQQHLAEKYHFHITRHVLKFIGQCENCQKRK
jgi:Fur family transcriptional regulator, ferric uptake regulator